MTKVSVVMPFLNGANYMRESIDSLFAQDLDDWELILVDDGSTDESPAIAADLARRYPNIHLVHHPDRKNHGLAASRVIGSSHSRGDYLIFLDHDDLLLPNALSAMAKILDENPVTAAVFAATVYWAYDRAVADEDAVQSYYPLREGMMSGPAMLRDLIRSDHHHPANCSTLFRRTALLSVRDLTEPYEGMYEDTALLFKLLSRHDIFILDEPVSRYRLHRDSMSHQAQAAGTFRPTDFSPDRERFLRWVSASAVPLDWRSRLRLRWTLAFCGFERSVAKLNLPKAQAALAYVFARI